MRFCVSPWRRHCSLLPAGSYCSLDSQISLLAGKKQGIFAISPGESRQRPRISEQQQRVTKEFPTRRNREILHLNRESNWEFGESSMVLTELSIWDVSWHFRIFYENKIKTSLVMIVQPTNTAKVGTIFDVANMAIVDFCAALTNLPLTFTRSACTISGRN